jgi:4-amino-4-deoxy-L-arabinose transferase-like glycosyltransferase
MAYRRPICSTEDQDPTARGEVQRSGDWLLQVVERLKAWDVLLLIAVYAALTLSLRIGSGFEAGTDEEYELTKAFLVHKGHDLYRQIWNDQPPLHTILLARAFSAFGVSALVARVVASTFGLLLVLAMYSVLRLVAGRVAGWVAAAWLYTSPQLVDLFHVAMLEAAAVGLGLASLALALRSVVRPGCWRSAVLSGLVLAACGQVKFTGLLIGLVGGAVLLWPQVLAGQRAGGRCPGHLWWVWIGSAVVGFVALAAILPEIDYRAMYFAHTARPPDGDKLAFHPQSYLTRWELMGPLLSCAGLSIWQRQLERLRLPLLLFTLLLVVHTAHTPFWAYYNLHFAVPAAWFCGLVAGAVLPAARKPPPSGWSIAAWRESALVFASLLCVGFIFACIVARHGENRSWLLRRQQTTDSAAVALLEAHSKEQEYVYTRDLGVAFAARRMTIPWLSVLPLKRFWSGQVTSNDLPAQVTKARPAVILLKGEQHEERWQAVLADAYRQVASTQSWALFRLKSPLPGVQGEAVSSWKAP